MPEQLHILFYEYVPDVVERRAPHREGHLGLIKRWYDDGRIVMAGTSERLLQSDDIKEFYLGIKEHGARGRRRWKRRKTWR